MKRNGWISTQITLTALALAILCGCQKQEEKAPPAPAPAPAKPAIVSAEKTSFDPVTAKLDKGGGFYLFLNTEEALGGLSEKVAAISNVVSTLPGIPGAQSDVFGKIVHAADVWLRDSGIPDIAGVGMSSIAREKGFYYNKVVVYHYPGQDKGEIWNIMGSAPHPLTELDLLPQDTAVASFCDLDLGLIWTNLQKHLDLLDISKVTDALQKWPAQYSKLTGLDFDKTLNSLAGAYGLFLTLDQEKKITLPLPTGTVEIPAPGLAIVIKVKSDLIFDRVDALCKSNPLVSKVDKPDLKMRSFAIPLPLPVQLSPTIARSGDYLILATTDTLIEQMLDIKSGKAKGYKSTAEFARVSQGIPDQGNNFTIVSDRFIKTLLGFQQQMLSSKANITSTQLATLQRMFNNATNFSAYSVGVNGADGWEGVGNGPKSIQSSVLPVAIAIGAAAAVAIPAAIKAHEAAAHQSAGGTTSIAPANQADTALYDTLLSMTRLLQPQEVNPGAAYALRRIDPRVLDAPTPVAAEGPVRFEK